MLGGGEGKSTLLKEHHGNCSSVSSGLSVSRMLAAGLGKNRTPGEVADLPS